MTQEISRLEVKNVSHKATDVGEINQGKNMLGEMREQSFQGLQHLVAGEKRRRQGTRWETKTAVAKNPKEEMVSRKRMIINIQCLLVERGAHGKPPPERAAWSLQEARGEQFTRRGWAEAAVALARQSRG